ncbi:hypothetical protein ONS95_010249 [Cadophora gregata]|uniref:uncharacterized protein n=1 Tax=Cadophora gregata TaxID=51156 RepID=UPI0026DCEA08|nr:uncharacterized protein ONS95_010249 [Cadophora gregata]KAK0121979.1 hypothetical protein ONS95_010249 [Cadophora gregata]
MLCSSLLCWIPPATGIRNRSRAEGTQVGYWCVGAGRIVHGHEVMTMSDHQAQPLRNSIFAFQDPGAHKLNACRMSHRDPKYPTLVTYLLNLHLRAAPVFRTLNHGHFGDTVDILPWILMWIFIVELFSNP